MTPLKLFLLTVLLPLLAVPALAKSKVAKVFANSEFCKTKMCLHGSFKKGTAVVLLSKASEQTCSAKVGKSFMAKYSAGAFEATQLLRIKSCKIPPQDVFLAVFDKPQLKYKILPVANLEEGKTKSFDSDLKKNRVFAKAWKKEVFHKEGNKDRVAYQLADYKLLNPLGFAVEVSKKTQMQILRHQFGDGLNEGISFIQYQKIWSPVSSSFSTGQPFAFSINGRLMILSTVTCQLNCGYQDSEVYEYNGKVFKLIYNNADFST